MLFPKFLDNEKAGARSVPRGRALRVPAFFGLLSPKGVRVQNAAG